MHLRETQSTAAPLGVAAVAACGCVALNMADPTTPGGPTPVCPTKALLGIDCPGCGTARMLYSILHFRIMDAIAYNAVMLVFFALLGWSWLVWFASTMGKRLPNWMNWKYAGQTVLIVFVAWFIIRLIPFPPFSSLRV